MINLINYLFNRRSERKNPAGASHFNYVISVLILCLAVGSAQAESWGPWEATGSKTQQKSQHETNPLDQVVRNFQKYISPIDGARCPMYPTCSAYARQALHKHGLFLGVFMTADRLIHEGDPVEQQEPVLKWGFQRYYDPVKYNDFWLDNQRD